MHTSFSKNSNTVKASKSSKITPFGSNLTNSKCKYTFAILPIISLCHFFFFIDTFSDTTNNSDRPSSQVFEFDFRYRGSTKFCTGSSYQGTWNQFGISGTGIYRFPNGVNYEGEFKDGHFHGRGTLFYPNGNVIHGHWHKGENVFMDFKFPDGLSYNESNWKYCTKKDKRFHFLFLFYILIFICVNLDTQ